MVCLPLLKLEGLIPLYPAPRDGRPWNATRCFTAQESNSKGGVLCSRMLGCSLVRGHGAKLDYSELLLKHFYLTPIVKGVYILDLQTEFQVTFLQEAFT